MNTTRTTAYRFAAIVAATLGFALAAVPAGARTSYVNDGAGLLNQNTIESLNSEIGDFNRQTGKEVVVVTVPSLDGQTLSAAAQKTFADQQVNGVLIFIAKADREDMVLGDRASSAFFPAGAFAHIHDAMRPSFRQEDFDAGVTTGVGLVLDQYRSHERGATTQAGTQPVSSSYAPAATRSSRGSHMNIIWLLIILLAGFLIIRAIFRAFSGPRMMPPPGQGGPPMTGPGYGPGYGAGYGGYGAGGGGGSFFSGLLGGLGGAWLGNSLFGGREGSAPIGGPADTAGGSYADPGNSGDASGWQSDAGQADAGNAGGGGWGSGGGFDAGGGGGGFDGGGGGGFDGGGGGGDGGGW